MSPRRTSVSQASAPSGSPIADLIAEAVRAALAGTSTSKSASGPGGGVRRGPRPSRDNDAPPAGAISAEAGADTSADTRLDRSSPPPVAAPSVAEPKPAGPSLAAAKRAAEQELLDRVRDDLRAAYEGVPVTPDRLAFRLKVDRDLVDGALLVLVQRKEARSKWLRGRPAYTPFFSV